MDAIPLNNKWVFIRKRDREGKIQQYKARLVVKGCGQCPGYNYIETHSPIVRLETIHAILAITVTKGLLIQQMDIKGAYLNGTLMETIYMRQPNYYNDSTGKVYKLKQILYKLKQSGQKWNMEFDKTM